MKLSVQMDGIPGCPTTSFVTVALRVGLNSKASFGLDGSFLSTINAFTIDNWIGKRVTIKQVDSNAEPGVEPKAIFIGKIGRIAVKENAKEFQIIVHVYPPGWSDGRRRHLRVFGEGNWGEIIDTIGAGIGVNFDKSEDSETTFPRLSIQQYEDDLDYLRRTAHRFGFVCYYDGLNWKVGKWPKNVVDETISPQNTLDLEVEYTARPGQFNTINRREQDNAWPPAQLFDVETGSTALSNVLSNSAGVSGINTPIVVPYPTFGEGERFQEANKEAERMAGVGVAGAIRLSAGVTTTALSVGNTFLLTGVLNLNDRERFRCDNFVHHYTGGEYTNNFTALPDNTWGLPAPMSEDPKPQLWLAKVEDNKDPERLNRVRLSFPQASQTEVTPWITVPVAFTGGGGAKFVPAIGDEVLVTNPAGWLDERPLIVASIRTAQSINNYEPQWRGWQTGDAAILTNAETGDVLIKAANLKIEVGGGLSITATEGLGMESGGATSINASGDVNLKGAKIFIN